jgi:hypothetical protein
MIFLDIPMYPKQAEAYLSQFDRSIFIGNALYGKEIVDLYYCHIHSQPLITLFIPAYHSYHHLPSLAFHNRPLCELESSSHSLFLIAFKLAWDKGLVTKEESMIINPLKLGKILAEGERLVNVMERRA